MFPFGMKPEDVARTMKRLGITIEEKRATRATVELEDGSRLVVNSPVGLLIMKSKDQPPVIMIVGEFSTEEARVEKIISDEDVAFVAEQAGASREAARRALEEVGGDVAAAIERLLSKREGR